MVVEMLETLDKYTIVQMLAAVPLCVVIWLIIREINMLRTTKTPPSNSGTVWAGAIGSLSEAVSGRFQEVSSVLVGVLESLQGQSKEHQSISDCLTALVTGAELHSSDAEKRSLILAQLVEKTSLLGIDIGTTTEKVNTMNDDLQILKTQMTTVLQSLETIQTKLDQGAILSPDSITLINSFIEHAQKLEGIVLETLNTGKDKLADSPSKENKVEFPPEEKKADV